MKRLKRIGAVCGALSVMVGAMLVLPVAHAAGNVIVGTTDTVNTLDPARCYNFYCSNVLHAVGQTLVTYPAGSSHLAPELAKSMPKISDNGLTYTFKLRHGVTFQNGAKMTSKDVKFSLQRSLWINDPEGAGFLLSDIKSIATPGPYTVVIHLKSRDITFTSKLAYVVATILPANAYKSPKEPIPDDAKPGVYRKYLNEHFVGSGPYKIENFRHDQSMLLTTWKGYSGKKPQNNKVLIRFYAKSSQLLVALKSGEVDVAFRSFTTAQRHNLEQDPAINTFKGAGATIRYLVFNPRIKPSGQLKVRKAVAAAINRQRIIKNDLGGAAKPLYSMVPPLFEDASVPVFKKLYGDKKASDYLKHKVNLTLWYSRGHYGPNEPSFAQTVKRTLEETGLFNVTLKSSEWAQFTANAYPGPSGQYAAFLMGWYPDYLDPDDYLAPFYDSKASFLRMYSNPEMDKLIHEESTASSPTSRKRLQTFAKIQELAAKDVPIIPLYVLTPYAFARKDISGVGKTMGPAQIFRYSVLSKSGS